MLDPVLLAALVALVAQGWWRGPSLATRVARLVGRGTRPHVVLGAAAGIFVVYGLSASVALALAGRLGAVATMPVELKLTAWRLGLPADPRQTGWMLGSLGLGAALGLLILAVRRWLEMRPIGLRYRSPAAARGRGERWPAAVLALTAGVSEELFFRLALPLFAARVTGSGVIALALATLTFALAHRHQGWVGVLATALAGAGLAYVYLETGQLWVAVLLHVAIDLHALILRPWISGVDGARTAA